MELTVETKRKLRDMGAADLPGALEARTRSCAWA